MLQIFTRMLLVSIWSLALKNLLGITLRNQCLKRKDSWAGFFYEVFWSIYPHCFVLVRDDGTFLQVDGTEWTQLRLLQETEWRRSNTIYIFRTLLFHQRFVKKIHRRWPIFGLQLDYRWLGVFSKRRQNIIEWVKSHYLKHFLWNTFGNWEHDVE